MMKRKKILKLIQKRKTPTKRLKQRRMIRMTMIRMIKTARMIPMTTRLLKTRKMMTTRRMMMTPRLLLVNLKMTFPEMEIILTMICKKIKLKRSIVRTGRYFFHERIEDICLQNCKTIDFVSIGSLYTFLKQLPPTVHLFIQS